MSEDVTAGSSSALLDRTEENAPSVSHIVRREDQMRGYVLGEPIEALCGMLFVPSRDPQQFPVCSGCLEVLENQGR